MQRFEYLKSNMDGKSAGAFGVRIPDDDILKDQNEVTFRVFLDHVSGQKALEPVATITYVAGDMLGRGRFEIRYTPFIAFEGTAIEKQRISIAGTEHELELFKLFLNEAVAGETFCIKYEIERRFLPAKSQHLDAREVLTALLNKAGFVDIEFVEHLGSERQGKDDVSTGKAVAEGTIEIAVETATFTAKKP
jgi:hypothetical protein